MASGGIALARLAEERKSWRKNHPHGFVAKPDTLPDGSVNLMVWRCVIPGKEGTDWEGGYFPLTLEFSDAYPTRPPTCKFPSGFFFLKRNHQGWKPSITVKQVLVGIQELMTQTPTRLHSIDACYELYKKNMPEYKNRVREQAKSYPSRV